MKEWIVAEENSLKKMYRFASLREAADAARGFAQQFAFERKKFLVYEVVEVWEAEPIIVKQILPKPT